MTLEDICIEVWRSDHSKEEVQIFIKDRQDNYILGFNPQLFELCEIASLLAEQLSLDMTHLHNQLVEALQPSISCCQCGTAVSDTMMVKQEPDRSGTFIYCPTCWNRGWVQEMAVCRKAKENALRALREAQERIQQLEGFP